MPDALYFEDLPLGEVVECGEEVLVFSSVVLLARRSEDL
jgi:hypothetical protein